ncbi:MAG: sigma-54-dependent Fis family transcriptional regulator [Candidatus Omnitrophica bacterium]|nr:sigma-54-dependent Fis family transcriptional regulator [Candidatus Omnitrophota bacterium]
MESAKYPRHPIVIVDDDISVVRGISLAFESAGITNITAITDAREVLPQLRHTSAELIVLDLTMPHLGGEEILALITNEHPDVPVFILTATADVLVAVRCLKAGATDYLLKPIEENRLIAAVKYVIAVNELKREHSSLKDGMLADLSHSSEAFAGIVTRNRKMIAMFKYAESIARSFQPVLLTGETGSGKELLARAIHAASGRDGQFIAVNVAGLDETAFTDTLFGHKRGAYTGAESARNGLVKEASGGTLFLDEIGDLPSALQMKLLRLLQENEYYPLGSDVALRSGARIIVATNKNLSQAQECGEFRKDLYYRLFSHQIHIPPLRERKDDLPLLVDYFIKRAATVLEKKTPSYPRELIGLLGAYDFPGNVRELEGMIRRAVSEHSAHVLSLEYFKSVILPDVDTNTNRYTEDPVELKEGHFPSLGEVEDFLIRKAMERASGNQSQAADILGISRQTLAARLRKMM